MFFRKRDPNRLPWYMRPGKRRPFIFLMSGPSLRQELKVLRAKKMGGSITKREEKRMEKIEHRLRKKGWKTG